MGKYNYVGNTKLCDADTIIKFKEDVFVDILIDTALGLYSAKEAITIARKTCGLKRDEFRDINSFELPDFMTERYLELFAIKIITKPKLLEMCIVCNIREWLEIFCLGGSIISLVECAESFHKFYVTLSGAYAKIKVLEDELKEKEIRVKIYGERAGLSTTPTVIKKMGEIKEKCDYVYLIQAESCFKIGVSSNVESRLASLQTGCPLNMRLVHKHKVNNTCKFKLEKDLHNYFSEYRVKGEWFDTEITGAEFSHLCEMLDKR